MPVGQFEAGEAAFGTGESENMYKVFICEISDDEGLRRQRYAVSAGNEWEVREAMLRYLGAHFSIKVIREVVQNLKTLALRILGPPAVRRRVSFA